MAISRGFQGRRRGDADPTRVPPGQYVADNFPVLSAGPTPHTPLAEWDFTIRGAADRPRLDRIRVLVVEDNEPTRYARKPFGHSKRARPISS